MTICISLYISSWGRYQIDQQLVITSITITIITIINSIINSIINTIITIIKDHYHYHHYEQPAINPSPLVIRRLEAALGFGTSSSALPFSLRWEPHGLMVLVLVG